MDLNDYTLMLLLQDRLTEMVAAAQRHALLRETTRPRRPFRAVLGTALIRLDAWLQAGLPIPWPLPVVTVTRASTLTQEGETMRGGLAVLNCRRASDPAAHE
jgi:hypothetical protein